MNKTTNSSAQDQSVIRQIDQLNRMSMRELRKKWQDLFGTDPGRLGRAYLIRRLAYRIQELVYGGLSQGARRRLRELAEEPRKRKPTRAERTHLQVGTRLLREWRGDRYEVIVKEDGFLYGGKVYRSLSAVARAITGRHCGGRRFFGLKPGEKRRKRQ